MSPLSKKTEKSQGKYFDTIIGTYTLVV